MCVHVAAGYSSESQRLVHSCGKSRACFFLFFTSLWIQCNSVTWLSTSPDCRLKTCIEKDYMSYEHVQQNVMWGHEPVWAEPACVCCLWVYFCLPFVLNRPHICNSPVYSSSSSYFIVTLSDYIFTQKLHNYTIKTIVDGWRKKNTIKMLFTC